MYFMVILGGYVLSSLFLFKNPTILHKKKKIKFKAQNISHRGGCGEYYENTITAFRRSLAAGSQMLELDCHITKDKKVVVIHDNDLYRLTGLNKFVSEENFDNLPPLQRTILINFMAGQYYSAPADEPEQDRRVPSLEEVFKAFPSVPINIDIKIDNDDTIAQVSELVSKYEREDITVWGSMNDDVVRKCYKQNSRVSVFFSCKQVCVLIFLFYTGLLPFVPIKEDFLEIFLPSVYERLPEENRPYKFVLTLANLLLIRKSLFSHLRKRGIRVYLWVLNQEDEFETALKLGADGIITDYPSLLNDFLNRNPRYRS